MYFWRISLLQVSSVMSILGLQYWIWESISVVFPLILLFLVTLSAFYFGAQKDWPQRSDVLALVPRLAVSMWFFSTLAYIVAFYLMPDQFSFSSSMLPLLAPTVSLAPGFATLILTLCAGDASLFMLERDTSAS